MDCDKIGWVGSRSNGSGQVYDRGAHEPSNFWHVEARVRADVCGILVPAHESMSGVGMRRYDRTILFTVEHNKQVMARGEDLDDNG
jgi:hypothetical protein